MMTTKRFFRAAVVVGVALLGASVTRSSPATPGEILGSTPQAYQYTAHAAIRDYATGLKTLQYPWMVGLAYNDDEIFGQSDETWTALASYEVPVNGYGWGVQVPEQYSDREGLGSLWYEGVNVYGYYNVADDARIGGYVNVNYAWSDVLGIDDEVSYGAGVFGSYGIKLGEAVTFKPAAVVSYYDPGQDAFDESTTFSVGTGVNYKASRELALEVLAWYNSTSNDAIDDSYFDWQLGVTYQAGPNLEIGASVGTTEGFDEFDRTSYKIEVGFGF